MLLIVFLANLTFHATIDDSTRLHQWHEWGEREQQLVDHRGFTIYCYRLLKPSVVSCPGVTKIVYLRPKVQLIICWDWKSCVIQGKDYAYMDISISTNDTPHQIFFSKCGKMIKNSKVSFCLFCTIHNNKLRKRERSNIQCRHRQKTKQKKPYKLI